MQPAFLFAKNSESIRSVGRRGGRAYAQNLRARRFEALSAALDERPEDQPEPEVMETIE